jgi:hypothetical protein
MDSAAALTEARGRDDPLSCMLTLSTAGYEGHAELGELVRTARARGHERVEERLARAVAEGELDASVDIRALARFVLTVQSGMTLQARDGASRADLEAVARLMMSGWETRRVLPHFARNGRGNEVGVA